MLWATLTGNRPASGLPDSLQTAGLLALLKAFNLLLVKKRACRLKNLCPKKTPDFKGRIVAKIHGKSLEIRDK